MPHPLAHRLEALLTRAVIPAWILLGAAFKWIDASPRLLPRSVLEAAHLLGVRDLHLWLALLITIEVALALGCILFARLARALAIAQLSVFVAVLVLELRRGASHCGCLGASSPPAGVMLAIDLGLLALVVLLGLARRSEAPPAAPTATRKRFALYLTLIALAALATFKRIHPALQHDQAPAVSKSTKPRPRATGNEPATTTSTSRPGAALLAQPTEAGVPNPAPEQAPSAWFADDLERWVGRPWQEVALFRYMPRWPSGLERGERRFVIFYRRDCDHCERLFWEVLTRPEIARSVTVVEVPQRRDRLRENPAWPMPPTEAERLRLPLGTDWIIQTPLVITIERGIVTCAEEGGHTRCLGL